MRRYHTRIVACLFIVLLSLIGGTHAATAQDLATPVPSVEHINVSAKLCSDLDCFNSATWLANYEITVVIYETGEVFDSCITPSGTGLLSCELDIPTDIRWDFVYDPSQTPDGYRPYRHGHFVTVDGQVSPLYSLAYTPIDFQGPPSIDVRAALCTDASCDEYDEFLEGFTISTADPDSGELVTDCTTGSQAGADDFRCTLGISAKSPLDITWDDAQVPEGYTWFGQLITVEDGPEGSVTTIAFVPDDAATATATVEPTATPKAPVTPAPVTSLPDTGTGDETTTSRPVTPLVAFGLMVLVLGIGLARQAIRSRR